MSITLSPALTYPARPWRALAGRLRSGRTAPSRPVEPTSPGVAFTRAQVHGDLVGAYMSAHRGVVR